LTFERRLGELKIKVQLRAKLKNMGTFCFVLLPVTCLLLLHYRWQWYVFTRKLLQGYRVPVACCIIIYYYYITGRWQWYRTTFLRANSFLPIRRSGIIFIVRIQKLLFFRIDSLRLEHGWLANKRIRHIQHHIPTQLMYRHEVEGLL